MSVEMMKKFNMSIFGALIIMIFLVPNLVNAQVSGTADIPKWKDDADGAYTLIHDDLCDLLTICTNADPAAYSRGLVFAAGAIVMNCDWQWDDLNTLVANGHEIICHSWSHPDFIVTGYDSNQEIVQAKQTLEDNLTDQDEVTFWIYPYDNYSSSTNDDLESGGFLGARVGKAPYGDDRGLCTDYNNYDPWSSNYFYVYKVSIGFDLLGPINDAINQGGWAIQEMHAVDPGAPDWAWETCPENDYANFLDYLKAKVDAGQIWNDVPTKVMKYIMTAGQCGDASISSSTLTFSSPGLVQNNYNTEITVLLYLDDDPINITATQNSVSLDVTQLSTTDYSLWVDPTLGPVNLVGGTAIVSAGMVKLQPHQVTLNRENISVNLPEGAYALNLYSMNGRKIATLSSGYSHGGLVKASINTRSISDGFYLLDINYKGGKTSQKILLFK